MSKANRKRKPKSKLADRAGGAPAAAAQSGAALLAALELLEQRREPYARLLARIVADTFDRFPVNVDVPIVEIGAGAGQLRAWLPAHLATRAVHTDPSRPALMGLRARVPAAAAQVAAAQALPFATGSCGAVVALCVFDAIRDNDAKAVVEEIARVLAPGGRFVHFLDMATLLEAPFAKLAASGLIPIPNVFGDPAETEWPLDIVLLDRAAVAAMIALAREVAHPLSTTFGPYFAAHMAVPFDVDEATRSFKTLASSGERRRALMTALRSISVLGQRHGHPALQPLPFHSGKYLQSVLDSCIAESGAFEIELSGILAASEIGTSDEPGVRYRSLCVGHQRVLDTVPLRRLVTIRESVPPAATLVEAGVFVFVARRR